MSDELTLTTDEIESLGARLEAWDGLSDRDREVLGGLFALAGSAIAAAQPTDEVSGFALDASGTPGGGAFESFQWGVAQGQASKPMFLRFDFKLVAVKTISWSGSD
jgi:hypothetical protein